MLAAQTPNEPAPADPVIRVSVDLVQVDATVTDGEGRHVTDLQTSDFEVLEDGKPQRITHFSFVPAGRLPGGPRAVATRLGERPTGASPTPTQPLLKAEEVTRSVVLMADDLGISFGDMPRIKSAMNDYYLIGYNPSRSDYGPAFHRIQVRVLRPGLQVRTRSGFMGKPDATTVRSQPTRADLLRQALFSPFQGNVPLRLRVIRSAGPVDPKTGHRQALLRGRVEIDPKTIEFREGPDGLRTAVVDISGTALGIDGQSVPGADQTYTISLSPKEYEETMASGLFYELLVVPPRPGPYQFVVGLRDTQSGNTGSANAYVEVPDANAKKLGLSSIELGTVGSTDRIRRTFQSGAVLGFAADVYGARKGADKLPQIEFAIRLHRGPEQIFTGKTMPMPRQIRGAQTVVSGEIKLPAFLPPGDYAVELVVRDKLAGGKSGTTSEWVELTLLPPRN